jgi:hypothetical protein
MDLNKEQEELDNSLLDADNMLKKEVEANENAAQSEPTTSQNVTESEPTASQKVIPSGRGRGRGREKSKVLKHVSEAELLESVQQKSSVIERKQYNLRKKIL